MEIDGFFSALLVGLVIGALGRAVIPGRQAIPIWLTLLIGVVAAMLGTGVANTLGVAETSGVDWIEIAAQTALAACGVWLVAGAYVKVGR